MGKSAALKILPEEAPLRSGSPFLRELDWEEDRETTAPRALRALAQIIEGGLCHRCGSCVGICPTATLGNDDEGYPSVKNLSACTDCDLCVKVCPGDEFDFTKHHKEKFDTAGDKTSLHGHFLDSFIGYATYGDLREKSTSGGLVTALLLYLLEKKEIDGALLITSDEKVLWKGKPIIARTPEEILAGVKSKYAISPTNTLFSEILNTPGRYAIVGLPCQIHGFVKACELDKRLEERVVLSIGLYCHAAVEHPGYDIIWESLGEKAKRAKKFTSRIGKHPGAPHIELDDGSLYPVYFGDKKGYQPSSMEIINILYRLYSPARCLTCFDASAEFADIAIGDPWMAPPDDDVDFLQGWSYALVRSERAKEICKKAEDAGYFHKKDLTRREALSCNTMMASEKKGRAFRIIETQKRQGKAIPVYDSFGTAMPKQKGIQFLKTEINMLTHFLCFMPKWRAPVLKLFLGNGGYWMLWLNNQRRTLRTWLRDSIAKLRRTLFGRS